LWRQALFLCAANIDVAFMENLMAMGECAEPVLYRFTIPAKIREIVIEQLWLMNVTPATLFPDLGGLGRSLKTLHVRPPIDKKALLALLKGPRPWERS
jgi:hypothetical protein